MAATVSREVVLPAGADEVWEAITDPDALREWFGADVELGLEPGAPATFRAPGDDRRGVLEQVEPGRRLSYRWWPVGDEDQMSRVAFTLEPVPSGTLLTVVEEQVAAVATAQATATWARRCTALVWAPRLHMAALAVRA